MKPLHHRHVQTVVGAVEDPIKLVEALVLRLALRFGAEMPLAEHSRVVSPVLEHSRQRDFLSAERVRGSDH